MKRALHAGLVLVLGMFVAGCWVARTAHDRPELRANVGRRAVLAEPYNLVRDRGGRLHLAIDEALGGYTLVERLQAGSVLRIHEVVYRISDPGRRDYYVVQIETSSGRIALEVPAEARGRPAWRFEE